MSLYFISPLLSDALEVAYPSFSSSSDALEVAYPSFSSSSDALEVAYPSFP
jgi:hypothetical protein